MGEMSKFPQKPKTKTKVQTFATAHFFAEIYKTRLRFTKEEHLPDSGWETHPGGTPSTWQSQIGIKPDAGEKGHQAVST
jgi:hypothetical protein